MNHTEYWAEIRSLVKMAFEEAAEYEREPYECLWETLDGHEWVIYTQSAKEVIAMSPNDSYASDEWGSDGVVGEGGLQWSRMAFGAMFADCLENGSDLDWNEIPSSEEEE